MISFLWTGSVLRIFGKLIEFISVNILYAYICRSDHFYFEGRHDRYAVSVASILMAGSRQWKTLHPRAAGQQIRGPHILSENRETRFRVGQNRKCGSEIRSKVRSRDRRKPLYFQEYSPSPQNTELYRASPRVTPIYRESSNIYINLMIIYFVGQT